jgi:hypothetical protein
MRLSSLSLRRFSIRVDFPTPMFPSTAMEKSLGMFLKTKKLYNLQRKMGDLKKWFFEC